MSPSDPPHPIGGLDYPRSQDELQEQFPDDGAALDYLARLRWPEGFICPSCSSTRAWQTAQARWMCAACGRQTSATAGTIFHRLRTPLTTWFAAIWLITSRESGASPRELQRKFGFIADQTSWAWLEKLRTAMTRPDENLSGVVELGEVLIELFIGQEFREEADAYTDRSTVMIAVESLPDRTLGRVRLALADADRPANLVGFTMQVVQEGSTVISDQTINVNRLYGLGYRRSVGVAIPGTVEIAESPLARAGIPPAAGIALVGTLLTGWVRDTLHGPVTRQHLDYYLDEFTFRFGCRSSREPGYVFYRLLQQAVCGASA